MVSTNGTKYAAIGAHLISDPTPRGRTTWHGFRIGWLRTPKWRSSHAQLVRHFFGRRTDRCSPRLRGDRGYRGRNREGPLSHIHPGLRGRLDRGSSRDRHMTEASGTDFGHLREGVMPNCQHEPCRCRTADPFCSEACRHAANAEDLVPVRCNCGHAHCDRMFSSSRTSHSESAGER